MYPHLAWLSLMLVAIAVFVLFRHMRAEFMGRRAVIIYLVALAGMVLVTNYFVPYIWLRGHHHTAEFISVSEADAMLDVDDDVFVMAVSGEARAYPKDWMMIPHIAGDTVGYEEVVMTYCVLTNLPMPFSSYIDGQQSNLKVVSQAHNNLVMTDTHSGELFQQITATAPVTGQQLTPLAGQRMPWRSFKTLYPDGRVFRVVEKGPLAWIDKITYALFVAALDGHYNGPGPMFPTLRLDDDRLPFKEQIWGININGEQVAYSRSFLERQPLHNSTVGGEPIVVVWFPEYETVGVFSRSMAGRVVNVDDVDVYGESAEGRLDRVPQYPRVFWMVWSHWFPETVVMK